MTAFRFARVILPSLALSFASLAAPHSAGAAVPADDEMFLRDAADADGPATRRHDDRRRANDADWFRAPVQQGPQDFPSEQVHDAVIANTRAATARAMYRRAESAMHAAARGAQRDFEQSAELKQALADEQEAYDALQAARRDALKEVVENPKYQAMRDLRETLSERIADRRAGGEFMHASSGTRLISNDAFGLRVLPREDSNILSIAMVKLRVGSDASEMERDALAGNEMVRQARSDLAAANAKVNELRQGFERSLRENPDFKAARNELEDARIAGVTAETYLKGASLAAREALDFSYYLHRYDYYRYNRHDYGYGYGYGHGRTYPYYGANFTGRR